MAVLPPPAPPGPESSMEGGLMQTDGSCDKQAPRDRAALPASRLGLGLGCPLPPCSLVCRRPRRMHTHTHQSVS